MRKRHVGLSMLYLAPERIAGVSTFVFGITRALLARASHRYSVFVPRDMTRQWHDWLPEAVAPHEIVGCGPNPDRRVARVLYEQYALPRLLRARRIDVVYFPHTIAPRWHAPPCVVTVHDLLALSRPTDFSWHKQRYIRWTYGRLRRHPHAFATVSEFTRHEMCERLGIDPERIVVTPNALDRIFLEWNGGSRDAHDPYILSVGGTFPHKRLSVVIDAFRPIVAREPGLRLRLAGTFTGAPQGLAELRRQADASGCGDRIEFLPRLAREYLPSLYAGARAFVSASEFEGFGIPLIEAMAVGCPVVASPGAGVVETVAGHAILASDMSSAALTTALTRALAMRDDSALARARAYALSFRWENGAAVLERQFASL